MKRGLAKSIIMLAAVMSSASLVLFGFTGVALAEEERACICYCAIPKVGATPTPSVDTKMSDTECKETCEGAGYTVAACAFDASQTPAKNVLCFSESSCSNQGGTFGDNPVQPAECMPGTFYCYPDKSNYEAVELQVAVGGLTTTADYGEYVSTAYAWLMSAATIIAIVFIMIGGLQYAVAGGHGDTAKAKKRIVNAVVGLILLMCTWLILYTVNPNLLKLEVPQFPMIRQVELVGEGSCGYKEGLWGSKPYLKENGAPYDSPHADGYSRSPSYDADEKEKEGNPYTMEEHTNGKECGSEAIITEDWEGNEVLDGQTCVYDYCPPEGDEQPVCVGTGADAECLVCKDIGPGSAIQPSSTVCEQVMNAGTTYEANGKDNKHDDVYHYCFFSRAPDLFLEAKHVAAVVAAGAVGGLPAATAAAALVSASIADELSVGTCAAMTLDCSGKKWCGDYDNVKVEGNDNKENLDDMGDGGILGSGVDLRTICEADPCGLAPKMEYGAEENESCRPVEGDLVYQLPGGEQKSFSWNCKNTGGIGQYDFAMAFGIAWWQTQTGCANYDGSERKCG